jgi:cytochrome b6-f complex iron-sulfur subunit
LKRRYLLYGVLAVFAGALSVVSFIRNLGFLDKLIQSVQPEPEFEPSTVFRIGKPNDFRVGVDTKFLQERRIFVVRNAQRLYVIYGRCTHLGCTPDWVAADFEIKCPCHGSQFCMGSVFDIEGKNCSGPAVRPLDRAHISVNEAGLLVVDTNRLYQTKDFDRPGAFIPV